MINLQIKNNEVDVELEYAEMIGGKPKVKISGNGDLSHHLIEGLFNIIDKLAKMENCSHRKEDWGIRE